MPASPTRSTSRGLRLAALGLALACLAGCAARPLDPVETAFAAGLHGPGLDTGPVRVHRGAIIGGFPMRRPPRPQIACREKIWPPEEGPRVQTAVAGFVLGQDIFVSRRFWREGYVGDDPAELPLAPAMFLAHELTHVWQWQNRERTGYAAWRAAREHAVSDDPYLFGLDSAQAFLDYPFEQQAALVEEFVCCRALDPEGARTDRLYRLLAPEFPGLARTGTAERVQLPWAAADIAGICSDPR